MENETIAAGDLRLSPDALTVECQGVVTVQPLVMDVLMVLAGTADVVTRERLEAQVWDGQHVGYHALPRAISQARRALQEVRSGARIDAVPKRGYRLIAAAPVASTVPRPVSAKSPALRDAALAMAPWVGAAMTLGLAMHALGLHGSAWHYAALSILAAAFTIRVAGVRTLTPRA